MPEEPNHQTNQLATEIALSFLTVPFLGGVIGARSLQQGLIHLGETSEELFRGERLPILHFQQQNEIEIKE